MSSEKPLEMWFVNVGHGDCTIIKFPSERVMVVDICNSKDLDEDTENELLETAGISDHLKLALYKMGTEDIQGFRLQEYRDYQALLVDPIDVLKNELSCDSIFRFIVSHPDMDHLTGLFRLSSREDISITNFWDTNNTKEKPKEFRTHDDPRDWDEYQKLRKSESSPKVLDYLANTEPCDFWKQDGIEVLSPTKEIVDKANANSDWNSLSYVLKIIYGKSSVILPGDASIETQEDILERYTGSLSCSIYKAPHHGRATGYCPSFAKKASPDYIIVSVGKKPQTDASNKYRQWSSNVISTRFHGTIYARLWMNGAVEVFDHNNVEIS